MFGLLKMLFYTCVAVVVGVFIGTVPVGGRTMADRITSAYRDLPALQSQPAKPARRERAGAGVKPVARSARAAPVTAVATAPVTAGAANTPDSHTPEQRAALERLIANRAKR